MKTQLRNALSRFKKWFKDWTLSISFTLNLSPILKLEIKFQRKKKVKP